MKKYLGTVLISLASFNVLADTETCIIYADLAESTMQLRQHGISQSVMLDMAGEDDYAIRMVKAAYEVPRHKSKDARTAEVENFREAEFRSCLELMKSED